MSTKKNEDQPDSTTDLSATEKILQKLRLRKRDQDAPTAKGSTSNTAEQDDDLSQISRTATNSSWRINPFRRRASRDTIESLNDSHTTGTLSGSDTTAKAPATTGAVPDAIASDDALLESSTGPEDDGPLEIVVPPAQGTSAGEKLRVNTVDLDDPQSSSIPIPTSLDTSAQANSSRQRPVRRSSSSMIFRHPHLFTENYISPVLDSTVELITQQENLDNVDVVELSHSNPQSTLLKCVSNSNTSTHSHRQGSVSGASSVQASPRRVSLSNPRFPMSLSTSTASSNVIDDECDPSVCGPNQGDHGRKSISFYSYSDLVNYERASKLSRDLVMSPSTNDGEEPSSAEMDTSDTNNADIFSITSKPCATGPDEEQSVCCWCPDPKSSSDQVSDPVNVCSARDYLQLRQNQIHDNPEELVEPLAAD